MPTDTAPEPVSSLSSLKPMLRMATWRGSNSDFRLGKSQTWFAKLMPSEIVWMTQSESDGNISITMVYR